MVLDGDEIRLDFVVTIKNVGGTPATNVEAWAVMTCGGEGVHWEKAWDKIPPRTDVGFSLFPNDSFGPPRHAMLTKDEIALARASGFLSGRMDVGALISVTYDFVGGQGRTTKAYEVSAPHGFDKVDMRRLPVPKAEIKLRERKADDTAT